MAADPESYALIELPFYAVPTTGWQARAVWHQAVHGKPVRRVATECVKGLCENIGDPIGQRH